MFSYQIDIYENNQWATLKSWVRPFSDGTSLDDTLDAGTINVSCTKRSTPIKPFTKLRIIIKEDGSEVDRIYRLVASSKRVRRSFALSLGARYDWALNTIEVTKEMERRFIDTMTATKYLINNYASSGYGAVYKQSGSNLEDDGFAVKGILYTAIEAGYTFTVPSTTQMFKLPPDKWTAPLQKQEWYFNFAKTTLKNAKGEILKEVESNFGAPEFTYETTVSDKGNLYVVYDMDVIRVTTTGSLDLNNPGTKETTHYQPIYTFTIGVFEQVEPRINPSITKVCERLLYAGITRRKDMEEQEYMLDPVFAEKYKDVESPEFAFTNSTLFDALAQIGGKIHAIPRLIPRYVRDNPSLDSTKVIDDTHYYVTFDELGGTEQAPMLPAMVYQDHSISIDDWCGTLDSPSQNLCNTEDEYVGAITEFGNDYITCRTEDGVVEVNADNVIIRTSMPIQKIIKLECGFIPEYESGNTPVGDITAYVYEQAEYLTLSSYTGSAYPYSKAWALQYAVNDNKITGLSTVVQNMTSVGTAFGKYAIVNIIEAKTGISISLSDSTKGSWMQRLGFKVTYIPIVNARVQAQKPSLDDGGDNNNQLVYNQGANVAETSSYGEKMRGAIARLGHDVEQRTYDIFHYSQMPKCGQLLDGKYISNVDAEYDITKIRITVTLTKNFNQLSQYVGLNSNYRLYDVSEKQSVDRHIHYSETILIGSKLPYNAQEQLMIKNIAQMMGETIYPLKYYTGDTKRGKVQVAQLSFMSKDNNNIALVCLPVSAFAFGTSICFAFSLYDNYGAGFQITNEYESEANKATQKLVPYSDVYGEAEYLWLWMREKGWEPTLQEQTNGFAQSYPYALISNDDALIDTGANYLIISKDSREHLSFVYQCHYQATRPSIVIGSALARYNLYANKQSEKMAATSKFGLYLVWFDHTINGLNRYFNRATDGVVGVVHFHTGFPTAGDPLEIDSDGFLYWKSNKNTTEKTVYSYAVCRAVYGDTEVVYGKYELLFGENFENGLAPGESTPPIYFSAYPKLDVLKIAKFGTLVYENENGGNVIGTLYLQKHVKPSDKEYSSISDARINRYSYLYTETYENSTELTTIKLKWTEIYQSLKMYADGTEMVEGVEYEIANDYQTITLLNHPSYVKEIKAVYRVGTKNALDNSDGYVKTSDLVPFKIDENV